MICYKDMAFCSYYEECKDGDSCERSLTEELIRDVNEFCPLLCRFTKKPSCFKKKK